MPTLLELYGKLKPKLGEQEAGSLPEFIKATVEQRAATKADLQEAVATLREEMQRVKADLVKWSFAFWVGNVAALAGIMPAMLRFRG
ncbi:MAG: hypothetical protein ACP5U2_12630 [Bryobacteraceae bacterium]